MEENRIQYRPTKSEEDRLFLLNDWVELEETKEKLGDYTISHILSDIRMSWEYIDQREELCSKPLEETKDYLIKKYYTDAQLSLSLKNGLLKIKENLHQDIYKYYLRVAENPWSVKLKISRDKYIELLMIETGLLPKFFIRSIKTDIDKECDEFIQKVNTVNKLYQELVSWIATLVPNKDFDEEGIEHIKRSSDLYIHSLDLACKNENALQKVSNEILTRNTIEKRKESDSLFKLVEAELNAKSNKVKLFPNQEKFYKNLELWANSIRNPKCKEWILNYLDKGLELPFYKIKVFRYIKDIEKAKEYLLSRYEDVLKYRYEKELNYKKKNEKYSKIQEKKTKSILKRYLKESGQTNYNDEDFEYELQQKERVEKYNPYPLGYEGTWAHDEAGYSNDDIDTIFDGDPDAYWNID